MGAKEYNAKQLANGNITPEMLVSAARALQEDHGLTVDGYFGPDTQEVAVVMDNRQVWTPYDGPLDRQPKNRADAYDIFGNPGTGSVNKAWEKANIVTVRDLAGVPSKWYFMIHKLALPYAREGFRRAHIAAPAYKIERAASFVFRHQRHDATRPLSYHSWGIAIDVDPVVNFSKTFAAGETPEPWSTTWRNIWPRGLPRAFVEAMESVGWRWGGRWKGFVDPMHFEWVGSNVSQV